VSITNSQLRWVKSLSKKSARLESGRFFAEGAQSLKVLADSQFWLETVYLTDEFARDNAKLVEKINPDVLVQVSSEQIGRMADATTPQGALAICKLPQSVAKIEGQPVIFLEQISDPGNLGTIIRTADAAGAGTIILGADSVDAFSPKVVRSSAGSIFNIRLVQGAETAEVFAELRESGYQIFAADMSGESFQSANLKGKHAWVFGNEAHGLKESTLDLVDECYAVPIFGKAESLNLSVAAGLVLYHSAFSQRG
jgi:TrmH family RNA methyltransferase